MLLVSLTYISAARVEPAVSTADVANIVGTAQRVNASSGVTGTLLWTGAHFVQTIEGDGAIVAALMASIARDCRHDVIAITENRPIVRRAFPCWSMGYAGPSFFVAELVQGALKDAHLTRSSNASRLRRFMREFTQLSAPADLHAVK